MREGCFLNHRCVIKSVANERPSHHIQQHFARWKLSRWDVWPTFLIPIRQKSMNFFDCILRKNMLCALEAFIFPLVTMVSGKNVSNQCCWTGIANFNQFLQGFVIRTFSQHSIVLSFVCSYTFFFTAFEKLIVFTSRTIWIN